MTFLEHLAAIDSALVAAGWPPLSRWWWKVLRKFYNSKRRRLVMRAGRRAGKSTTMERVALCEMLFGDHNVPPGDIGLAVFISVSKEEARARLASMEKALRALGVPFKPAAFGEGFDLVDRPTGARALAATIGGVSGFTAIALFDDEVSKWADRESGANPADTVLSTARPMTATMPNAREFMSSSPLGQDDAHARAFDDGDTDHQMVVHGATWTCNPTITEAATRSLEPDNRVWLREYAAIPQAGKLGAFDPDAIARAFRNDPGSLTALSRALIIDPSSGRKDTWAWGLAGWSLDSNGITYLVFDEIDGMTGSFWRTTSGADVVARVASKAKKAGVTEVHSDQRESLMLAAEFEKHGLRFYAHDWTSASKPVAVETLRRLFADSRILLPSHDTLRRELGNFQEKITPGGSITFGARGNGHDDFVALLITACMSDLPQTAPPKTRGSIIELGMENRPGFARDIARPRDLYPGQGPDDIVIPLEFNPFA